MSHSLKIFINAILFVFVIGYAGCQSNITDKSEKSSCKNLLGQRKISSNRQELKEGLKVMTFNVRASVIWKDYFMFNLGNWKKRKDLVVNEIRNQDCDIIGLQEVMTASKNQQLNEIKESLSEYLVYWAGRGNGKDDGEACPIFFRKTRFRLEDSGTFWFSSTPDKPGSKYNDIICPRICSYVKLFDKANSKSIYIFNLHLDPYSSGSRKKSIKLLCDKIVEMKVNSQMIIMGDFNTDKDSPAIKQLEKIENLKVQNAWDYSSIDKNWGTEHPFNGNLLGRKIDHIIFSGNLIASDVLISHYNVNGKYPSDHYAVIAHLN